MFSAAVVAYAKAVACELPATCGDPLSRWSLAELRDEDLAVARLAFLAQGDHAALDMAIEACLARTERTLYTRWRVISFLVRVRYEDQPTPHQPTPEQPATSSAGRSNGGKGRAPGSSRGPR